MTGDIEASFSDHELVRAAQLALVALRRASLVGQKR